MAFGDCDPFKLQITLFAMLNLLRDLDLQANDDVVRINEKTARRRFDSS
jgi:hypothetical protein